MLRNFSFIVREKLAGMAWPGEGDNLDENLTFLKEKGITAIVSLTTDSLDIKVLSRYNFHYLHLPVPDFSAPSIEQVIEFISFVDRIIKKEHGAIVVHCGAGLGRTGTFLACYLVGQGMNPNKAIATIRFLRPKSIEVYSQEELIKIYWNKLYERSDG